MTPRRLLVAGQVRHLNGWIKDADTAHFVPRLPPPLRAIPSAASVRARMPPVYDQSTLGSCTSHALLECMEALEDQSKPVSLYSRLYLYFKEREIEGTIDEDAGAQLCDGITALAQCGAPLEALWPYDVTAFAVRPPVTVDEAAAAHKLFYAYRCAGADEKPSLWAIRASIAQGFPVAVGARLPASFSGDETARTGVVTPPDASDPCSDGHAFSVVGYDDARRMLTCQNSWGTDWGANGLFYWPYDMVDLIMDAWTLRKAAV